MPLGTLFFGYALRLPKKKDGEDRDVAGAGAQHKFAGRGMTIKESNKLAKKGSSSATPNVIEID